MPIDRNAGSKIHPKYGLPFSALKLKKKKLVTVDDLLTKDEINDVLNIAISKRSVIKDIIILTIDNEDKWHYIFNDSLTETIAVFLLEKVKNYILSESEDEE